MTRGLTQWAGRDRRPLRRNRALALGLAMALASGCGMYGDLTLEERPVRTPEITELEPISAPTGDLPEAPEPPADPPSADPPSDAAEPDDGDRDEARKNDEDDPAGVS